MKPKKKAKPITESPRYDEFIKSRDAVLESILRKYQRALDRAVDHLRDLAVARVAHAHVSNKDLHYLKYSMSTLEHYLDRDFEHVERDVSMLLYRMRGTVYALSHVGQAVAIQRSLGKDATFDLTWKKIESFSKKEMRGGGPIEHRAWLGFERLKRKIVDAYQRGILFDETTQEVIDRVLSAFPKAVKYKRVPTELRRPKLKEAEGEDNPTAFSLSKKLGDTNGIIEPELWDQMVNDYTDSEIPFYANRAPMSEETYYEEHGKYEWEVENEATQEFVDQVRAGEIDAAKENGITDMVWIAVIDGKTDDCCLERDGLTVTEIEDALDSGTIDDDCDATVPPAHFNCRCRIAPLTDDLPEKAPPNDGSFDEWLDQRK